MTTAPVRIQRRRTKGWRTPANTVIVTRPSRFGNPFTLAMAIEMGFAETNEQAHEVCVTAFRSWVRGNRDWWMGPKADAARQRILEGLPELRGKNLACYCPASMPCHADVLIELAGDQTVFVIVGASGYHRSLACEAFDSAYLHAGPERLRVTTVDVAAAIDRAPCLVCAAPPTDEWTVTAANLGELWELIAPSKLHTSLNAVSGKVEVDGLTILEHDGLPRALARFGDTIRFEPATGRYAVTPAAITES